MLWVLVITIAKISEETLFILPLILNEMRKG
jgi:hypothetical protein